MTLINLDDDLGAGGFDPAELLSHYYPLSIFRHKSDFLG